MKKFFCSLLVLFGLSSFVHSSADLISSRDGLAKDIGLDISWGDQPYQVKEIKVGDIALRPVQNTEEMQKFFVALFGDADVVKHYATGKPIEAETVKKGLVWRSGLWDSNLFSSFALYDRFHRLSGRVTVGHGAKEEGEGVSEIEAIWTPDFRPHMMTVGVTALKWTYFVQQLGVKASEKDNIDPSEVRRFNVGRWANDDGSTFVGAPLQKIMSTVSEENVHMVKALELLGFTKREEKESRHGGVVKWYYELPFTFASVAEFNTFIAGVEHRVADAKALEEAKKVKADSADTALAK